MAIAHDSTTSESSAAATTHDLDHTPAGSNRYTIVRCAFKNAANISSVAWDPTGENVALDFIGRTGNANAHVEMWGKAGLSTGTKTMRVTTGASHLLNWGVSTYTGVDQGAPTGTYAGNQDTTGGAYSQAISSAADDMVVDVVQTETGLITFDASQTERWSAGNPEGGGSEELAVGASTTMSGTSTGGDDTTIAGVALKPSTAAEVTSQDGLYLKSTLAKLARQVSWRWRNDNGGEGDPF